MRIVKYLNTTENEVLSRQHNIFVGISLGNKYFTKEHTREYVSWALAHTKKDVVVLIADKIHATNFEVLKGYDKASAFNAAKHVGDEVSEMVRSIIRGLPASQQTKVHLLRWDDIEKDPQYGKTKNIIYKEFESSPDFRSHILEIVRENLGEHFPPEQNKQLSLTHYVLDELPLLLRGIHLHDKTYTLIPYPGLSKLDELIVGLQNKMAFPTLAEQLNLTTKTALLEAYAD